MLPGESREGEILLKLASFQTLQELLILSLELETGRCPGEVHGPSNDILTQLCRPT